MATPSVDKLERADMSNYRLWHEVAARTDLVGGDIEVVQRSSGDIYRGRLIRFEFTEDSHADFRVAWMAYRKKKSTKWVRYDSCGYFLDVISSRPTTDGAGIIRFSAVPAGQITLYPKGVDNLDPKLIEGLDLTKVAPTSAT